jgi:hypothetical protein
LGVNPQRDRSLPRRAIFLYWGYNQKASNSF